MMFGRKRDELDPRQQSLNFDKAEKIVKDLARSTDELRVALKALRDEPKDQR